MNTPPTKLQTAIDNYVKSVRILLATIIMVPILALIGYYAPFILFTMFWIPPCFIVLALLARENEKMKDVIAWSNWMDERMQSEEYLNALIYLHRRQLFHEYGPHDLGYSEFLIDKNKKGDKYILL